MRTFCFHLVGTVFVITAHLSTAPAFAQANAATAKPATNPAPAVAPDYVIGADDVIGVMFWREQEMSGDLTVRPDGMISLPLIGDIKVAGYRPADLKVVLEKATAKYLTEPNVTVVVRQIKSRKVFITGQVARPGEFALSGPQTVLQLIALAGGLTEYADGGNITVMRTEAARTRTFKFNYRDVSKGKRLEQNLLLQPGDTVVVP